MPGVVTRVLEPGDREPLAAAVDRARTAGEFRPSSDPDAAFFLKSFDLDPRLVGGAFDDHGGLVGFVSSEFKVVVVTPERRRERIGTALVDLAAQMELDRDRPNVLLGRRPDDAAGRAFLEATGFRFHSTLFELDLPRDRPVVQPSWPGDVVVRPFSREAVPDWVALFNAAFANHPTPLQLDATFITADLDDPDLDDGDTLLLADVASGELVGFCAAAPQRHAGVVDPHGEIWTIGVRPDRQGRGLGRQLLRWGVARLRSIGVREISLSVNALNEGALALYEAEGFGRVRSAERWARPVTAPRVPAG